MSCRGDYIGDIWKIMYDLAIFRDLFGAFFDQYCKYPGLTGYPEGPELEMLLHF
jgi:hypothetical protein